MPDYRKVELFASQLKAVYPNYGLRNCTTYPPQRPIVGVGLQLFGESEKAGLNSNVQFSIQEPEFMEDDDEVYARLPSWIRALQKLRNQAMDAGSQRRDF